MNVSPIRQLSAPERHVYFSDNVQVQIIESTESAPVMPSMYAQRLERHMRNATNVTPQSTPAPASSPIVLTCKNAMFKAALACGALFLPSFAALVLGPIGLIVPGALLALTVLFYLLAGKPTQSMEQSLAARHAEARRSDSQCN